MNGCLLASSVLNNLTDTEAYTNLLPMLALPMLIELGLERGEIDTVLEIIFKILATLTIINFIFLIIYPGGLPFANLYTNTRNPLYFLGYDNGVAYNLLTLLGINYFLYSRDYSMKRLKFVYYYDYFFITPRINIFNLISLISIFIIGSAIGSLIICIFIILVNVGYLLKIEYNPWIFFTLYIILFFMIIMSNDQSALITSLTEAMGRDGGFTGRSLLWKKAVELILQKPFLGWGNNSDIIEVWGSLFSAHNQILDLVLRGGFLTLLFYLALQAYTFFLLKKNQLQTSNVLLIVNFCFLLGGLMEAGIRPVQFIFLALTITPYYEQNIRKRSTND